MGARRRRVRGHRRGVRPRGRRRGARRRARRPAPGRPRRRRGGDPRRLRGVEARTVAVDLTADDAVPAIVEATRGPRGRSRLLRRGRGPELRAVPRRSRSTTRSRWSSGTASRRCGSATTSPPRCAARGRGGIVLVSSGAGLVGGRNMVAYGATKAFDMVMAEALWAELHGSGVDVLGLGPRGDRHPGAAAHARCTEASSPISMHRSPARRRPSRSSPRRSPTWPTARPASPPTTCARVSSTSAPCRATTPSACCSRSTAA